eukprot:Gb_07279 [translate_table: standard]
MVKGKALDKVNQIDSTMRSEEKAHEQVKLKPYAISLKKVLVMPNEGGVPLEEVKHQQGVQIKREYMVPYTLQEGEGIVVGVAVEIDLQVVRVVANSSHVKVDARIVEAILTGLLSYKTDEYRGGLIPIVIFGYGTWEANHGTLSWMGWYDTIISCSITCEIEVNQGRWRFLAVKSLKWRKAWKLEKPVLAMGGDPVTTEPVVLVVDEEVRKILEEAGFLTFFNKFKGNSDGVTRQFIDSWKEGRVSVDKSEFLVSASLIAEASGLPNESEVISKEKLNQVSQLTKFIKEKETFCWLDSGIARESLPKPWDRVAMVLMKYLTLEGKFRKLEISACGEEWKRESPPAPGADEDACGFCFQQSSPTAGPSKGGFTRVSGTPITKAQLLLGPIPGASNLNSGGSTSEEDEDSDCQEKNSSEKTPTGKGGRKRKTPVQVLSSSLAKCSRRSSRLQRKLGGKPSLLDVAESSEEERAVEDPSPTGSKSIPVKGPAANPSENVESPGGPFMVTEELKCHLRVLNSLGSSLSSTCACVNLLTIEVTNYLKEVLKIMKDKNLGKE